MEVCDVIEKSVSCCGKVCVSCVRAVLWMCGQLIASTGRLQVLGTGRLEASIGNKPTKNSTAGLLK